MKIENLQKIWENRKIYTTKNSIIREISIEEAINLYNEDQFFTEGLDFIIFDEDKYTVKSIIKYILEKEELEQPKSYLWLYITIIIISTIILGIVIFGIIGKDKNSIDKKIEEIQKTQNIVPIQSEKKEEIKDQIEIPISHQNIINSENGEKEIIADEKNTITQDNKLLLINNLNFEIETQRMENLKLFNENKILKEENKKLNSNNIEISEQNQYLEIKLKQTKTELEEIKKATLGEKTSLEKYLGAKLFETCRKTESNIKCEQLFNQFYSK